MKHTLILIITMAMLAVPQWAFAYDSEGADALTGGAVGALDAIDGNDVSVGDHIFVIIPSSENMYEYVLKEGGSPATESSPTVIVPDTNAGNKYWQLLTMVVDGITIGSVAIDEIVTSITGGGADDQLATAQAVDELVDAEIATQMAGTTSISALAGYVGRPMFEYKDADEIYIYAGRYHHDGTIEQMLYWDSKLTFQFGSGGSNAASSSLPADGWIYVYIDDSAVSGQVQVASEFVAITTAPTKSETKHGRYNSNDRCILALRTNSSNEIIEFYHDGGDSLLYVEEFEDRAIADLDTTFTAVTLTVPDFGIYTPAIVGFDLYTDNESNLAYYRRTGSTNANGVLVNSGYRAANVYGEVRNRSLNTVVVLTDASQQIDVKLATSGGSALGVHTVGYKFPGGM